MDRVAIGLLGVAILLSAAGIVTKGIKHSSPPQSIAVVQSGRLPHPELPIPAPNPARQPSTLPEADAKPPVAATQEVVSEALPTQSSEQKAKPRPAAAERKDGFQLRGGGKVVILASEEEAAAKMRNEPGLLSELVAKGLLFSAPIHTEVAIEERHDGLIKVRILAPAMEGRVGWVRAEQVTAK
jgi:hypothetical protein